MPHIGGDGFVDVEHDGSRGSDDVARDAICLRFDGERHKAFSAVVLIVDGQKAFLCALWRQTCGRVYALEYPEGFVGNDVYAGHHIHIDAHVCYEV